MAITGPFSTTENFFGYSRVKTRYRQGAPYTDPLPYSASYNTSHAAGSPWGDLQPAGVVDLSGSIFSASALVVSKAYGKFVEEARSQASLGVNLAERKQTIDMIASRGAKMLAFCAHLSAFRFVKAVETLGFSTSRQRVSRKTYKYLISRKSGPPLEKEVTFKRNARSFADNFLEVHFGWSPLVKDIYSLVEIALDDTSLSRSIRTRASHKTPKSATVPSLAPGASVSVTEVLQLRCLMQGSVRATGGNSLLMNQLGLINPAVILWERVPFSFVADWFGNIGQVLASYTDFVGLSLSRTFTTLSGNAEQWLWYNGKVGSNQVIALRRGYKTTAVRRTLGISTPTLTLKGVNLPSITRGLTAISLLSQKLRKFA